MPQRPRQYRPAFVPRERPKGYNPNFRKYDDMKARWVAQNPDATPSQYQDAMRAIAHLCGI